MIKCTDADKKELLEYLKQKPSENGFLIGDIENYSLDEDFLDVWMLKSGGNIEAVLMRYYKYFHISTENMESLKDLSEIIKGHREVVTVSGIGNAVERIADYIEFRKIRKMNLAELKRENFTDFETSLNPVKAEIDDLNKLFEFEMSIEEFDIEAKSREGYGKDLITGTGRIYFLRENSRIVAKAGVSAENSENGVIIGVATDKNYRNRGYAKACLISLCRELLADGKCAVLFYDNPDAGKLYKSVGFRDINRFVSGTPGQVQSGITPKGT